MPDYFAMGSGLASAYSEGKEEQRLRQRQIDQDERQKVVDGQRDTEFGQRTEVYGRGKKQYDDVSVALGAGDAPAGLPTPAANNPSAFVAPAAKPAPAAGGLPAPGAAPTAAAAPAAFDPHLARLTQARDLARASRDVQGLNTANAAIAQHQMNLEDGATVAAVMKGTPEQHMELFKHVNQHSSTLTMRPQLDAKGKPTGYTNLEIVGPGGEPASMKLSLVQLAKVAVAEKKLQRGDMTGMDDLGAISDKLAAAVAAEMGLKTQVTTANNTARHNANADSSAATAAGAAATSAGAAATNARTHARVADAQIGEITENRRNLTEARQLQGAWDSMSPEDQAGPKGLALRRQFNMANAKPGTQLGASDPRPGGGGGGSGRTVLSMPVDQKQNPDGTYTAFAKDGGRALYNTVNGLAIPLGMSATDFDSHKKNALKMGVQMSVVDDGAGGLLLGYAGADGNMHTSPEEAAAAKPAKASPRAAGIPAPAQRGVDSDGMVAPGAGLPVRSGARVPDVRGMLRTPSAAAGPNSFTPND